MNERDFLYWLRGIFEVLDPDSLTKEQVDIIKRHMKLVFPQWGDPNDLPPIIHDDGCALIGNINIPETTIENDHFNIIKNHIEPLKEMDLDNVLITNMLLNEYYNVNIGVTC